MNPGNQNVHRKTDTTIPNEATFTFVHVLAFFWGCVEEVNYEYRRHDCKKKVNSKV